MASPRKVMIVDDEPDIVASARMVLRRHGFSADGFTEPEEAFEEFKKDYDRYSLVISDIRMPGMGGFELARNIRMIQPDAVVVFMTAFEIGKAEFSRMFPSTPVAELVKKPVSNAQLVSIARKYLCITEQN